ncbi:hypothetical protein B0T10DRAFT_483787 [Thelonectria olida]|uniref:Wax synthase domain-containing protein n=1 Tax=Thelonectria olida TaxID=1576542 RepID=A0A9P9ANU1_9HYPO|nr:hypothetical protein B0T10DRAFT_483787 [Thelonectria olida]
MNSSVSVSAFNSPRIQNILPFVALPLLIITSFASPPFLGRGVAFSGLLVFTYYACIVSPWPPNDGTTRAMRYGMTGSWMFLLTAIERHLFHHPEMDFRILDEEKRRKNRQPPEWTLQKLHWAFALVCTLRGVGWNMGNLQVKAVRDEIRNKRPNKASFVAAKTFRAALAYLALDTVMTLAKHTHITPLWAWDPVTLLNISFLEFLMAVSVYATMSLQFELVAAVSVGIGLCNPEDWPPLFGSATSCYTVANVWGKFWHGYIRQPVLGFSHAIISFLGIPRRSYLAYSIHLFTAFFISALFHTLSLFVVSEGYLRTRDLIFHMGCFFMAQPVATVAESIIMSRYRPRTQSENTGTSGSQLKSILASAMVRRTIGYLWVVSWFVLTGWWFVQDYIAIGVLEWPLPISFWTDFGLEKVFVLKA